MPTFLYYFGWPHGAVWSNVAAEPIIAILTAILLMVFRKPLSKRLAAWKVGHHQHIKEHITDEINRLREELKGSND
jgi:hypothetical protein